MIIRKLAIIFCALSLLAAAPAVAAPKTEGAGETIVIPFDPPLDGSVKYRWQRTEERDGRTKMTWFVNEVVFEETEAGHQAEVRTVSFGSNETDPDSLRVQAKLEQLINFPFVLQLDANAEVVKLEDEDKYWAKIFQALRASLSDGAKPDEVKAIEATISLFQDMPPEARLAKMTEAFQPIVQFANTELTVGEPLVSEVQTASPFGGTIKQDVVITLQKVLKDVAYLTIRSTVSREEFLKVLSAFADKAVKLNPKVDPKEFNNIMGAADQLKFETVSDYQVTAADGLLQSYQETRTVVIASGDKTGRQVRTTSLTRVE